MRFRFRYQQFRIRARAPRLFACVSSHALWLELFILSMLAAPAWSQDTVRVGVYQNSPKVALSSEGKGMDGYAVARALRTDPKLAAVPIVAVTSYAMTGDRERSLAAGCNGYMEKPIDPETFAVEVERFVGETA